MRQRLIVGIDRIGHSVAVGIQRVHFAVVKQQFARFAVIARGRFDRGDQLGFAAVIIVSRFSVRPRNGTIINSVRNFVVCGVSRYKRFRFGRVKSVCDGQVTVDFADRQNARAVNRIDIVTVDRLRIIDNGNRIPIVRAFQQLCRLFARFTAGQPDRKRKNGQNTKRNHDNSFFHGTPPFVVLKHFSILYDNFRRNARRDVKKQGGCRLPIQSIRSLFAKTGILI